MTLVTFHSPLAEDSRGTKRHVVTPCREVQIIRGRLKVADQLAKTARPLCKSKNETVQEVVQLFRHVIEAAHMKIITLILGFGTSHVSEIHSRRPPCPFPSSMLSKYAQ